MATPEVHVTGTFRMSCAFNFHASRGTRGHIPVAYLAGCFGC